MSHKVFCQFLWLKSKKEFGNANIPRTVRFPEPLFEQLNRAAGRNGVSFNLLVLQCCKYALENMEEAPEEN